MARGQSTASRAKRYKSFRSISALLLREMSTSYGKSPGGYVWAIAEPVAAIAVLSMAFLLVFKTPRLGTNFPLYFATGYLPFMLGADIASKVGSSIRFSRTLLAYPMVRFTDAIAARILLTLITSLLVGIIVLTGIHIIFDLTSIVDPVSAAKSIAMAITLGTGLGTLNCYLFFSLPIWERGWAIVTRPLVLASGVVFLYDTMPVFAKDILWYNPYTHLVGMMRRGFYPTYEAAYISQAYVYSFALICLALGLMLLYRHEKAMIHN
ncbi:MAG: ABC transporter permease [Rhodobacteraceae bacterium]|nr:ABC transporter permease [Paracoccaceae bacterium]